MEKNSFSGVTDAKALREKVTNSLPVADFGKSLSPEVQEGLEKISELSDENFIRQVRPIVRSIMHHIRSVEGLKIQGFEAVCHMLPSPNDPDMQNPLIVLPGRGCGYQKGEGGCTMCNFAQEGRDATIQDVDEAVDFLINHFESYFEKNPTKPKVAVININALGSFFHKDELTPEVRDHIYHRVNKYKKEQGKDRIVVFVLEGRLDQITEENISDMREKVGEDVVIDVGVGIESTDFLVREGVINKGLPEDWKERLAILRKYDCEIEGHVMFGTPFLDQDQMIDDTVESVRDLANMKDTRGEKMFQQVLLMVSNKKPGTLVNQLAKSGEYALPDIFDVYDAVKKLDDVIGDESKSRVMVFGLVGPEAHREAGTEYLEPQGGDEAAYQALLKWDGSREKYMEFVEAIEAIPESAVSKKKHQERKKSIGNRAQDPRQQLKKKIAEACYRLASVYNSKISERLLSGIEK